MNDMTPIAGLGHNNPPPDLPVDPFDAFKVHIDGLFDEAANYLDGEKVETQAQADDISRILDELRKAAKDADAARAAEKKPHDEAGKAVQAKWKPLGDRAALAADTAKKALAPFLKAEQERIAADAAKARAAADALIEEARKARDAAAGDDLASRAAAADLTKAADQAVKAAGRAEKGKAAASGGSRAVTLRDVWTPALVDSVAALKHYRATQPGKLKEWLLEQAAIDVRAGSRVIPGFTITNEQVAQ